MSKSLIRCIFTYATKPKLEKDIYQLNKINNDLNSKLQSKETELEQLLNETKQNITLIKNELKLKNKFVKEYHIAQEDGTVHGPYSYTEICNFDTEYGGKLYVWTNGMPDWLDWTLAPEIKYNIKKYYYIGNSGEYKGPTSAYGIAQLIIESSKDFYVWADGMPKWQKWHNVFEIESVVDLLKQNKQLKSPHSLKHTE